MDIRGVFQYSKIIAATDTDHLSEALRSRACAVLLMHARITELLTEDFQEKVRQKPLFLHADLVKGLSGDKEAFVFLSKYVRPLGIFTTKSAMIRAAKKEGLLTVQRVFLIDTASFHTSIKTIQENEPDAIEIMPGIAPSVIKMYKEFIRQPIIVGGLISSARHVNDALNAGADAVSLSKSELWNLPR
jgi:glycerol uptake operon antiterminator